LTEIAAASLPARVTERKASPLVSEQPHANPTLDAVVQRAKQQAVLDSMDNKDDKNLKGGKKP